MHSDSPAKKIYSVSEINCHAKSTLENQIGYLHLRGECSYINSQQASKHWYFTLKDEKASISCVMYRGHNSKVAFTPKVGDNLLVKGYVTIYEVKGNYQLIVETMQKSGVGDLYVAFEAMKHKLSQEGLFAEQHKKLLPNWINHIGVVTSPSGAVVRDILNVLKHTAPSVIVDVIPCAVQGKAAKQEIINAITIAEQTPEIEVIIVARGGGSIEDLWCFNEEEVARAIFNCSKPIISAVGHETDFTISDFTADLRVATPSVAAKFIADKISTVVNKLAENSKILSKIISHKLAIAREYLVNLLHRLARVDRIIFTNMQILDETSLKINELITHKIYSYRNKLNQLEKTLIHLDPRQLLIKSNNQLQNLQDKLQTLIVNKILQSSAYCVSLIERLEALNPESVLKRGYSIVKKNSSIVSSYNQVDAEDGLDIILNKGYLTCKVCKTSSKPLK